MRKFYSDEIPEREKNQRNIHSESKIDDDKIKN